MILILSKPGPDHSIELVMDWLLHFKQKFKRLNSSEKFVFNDNEDEYSAVWFRSWAVLTNTVLEVLLKTVSETILMDRNIRDENKAKIEYLFYKIKSNYWLTLPNEVYINKLITLDIASKIGLSVPDYSLIDNVKELLEFKKNNNRIITKSIANPIPITENNSRTIFYTREITLEMIGELPNNFEISFFQKLIKSRYEVRVFYIEERTYSIAIFKNENIIDYRKYSNDLRQVPFQMPHDINCKIKKLMRTLALKTGSIDFICDENDKIYFLEVNPIGQFENVSFFGNYYLEREIALTLSNNEQRINR